MGWLPTKEKTEHKMYQDVLAHEILETDSETGDEMDYITFLRADLQKHARDARRVEGAVLEPLVVEEDAAVGKIAENASVEEVADAAVEEPEAAVVEDAEDAAVEEVAGVLGRSSQIPAVVEEEAEPAG